MLLEAIKCLTSVTVTHIWIVEYDANDGFALLVFEMLLGLLVLLEPHLKRLNERLAVLAEREGALVSAHHDPGELR